MALDTLDGDARGLHPVIAMFLLFAVVLVVGAVAASFVLDFGDGGGENTPSAPADTMFGCVEGRLVYTEGPQLQNVEVMGVTGPADQFPWKPGDGATIANRSALQVVWVGPEGNQSVILFEGCG